MFGRALQSLLIGAVSIPLVMFGAVAAAAVQGPGVRASHVKHGGTLTVLVPNGSWPELDVATDPEQLADQRILNDIDGQLFEQGANGAIKPDLATGYTLSDHNLTVTIALRHGVTFQDGTPFNAQAVAYNINRDLNPANACLCLTLFSSVQSVTSNGQYDVVMHLKAPYAPLIAAFIGNAPNEPQSPTALQNESAAKFGEHPIGAGPFKVVSMVPNTSVVLTRNPQYWEQGKPYLKGITFKSTSSDETDYEAIVTGQAQQTTISTIPLAKHIQQSNSLNMNINRSVLYYMVLFNSTRAPFNNQLVREALSYGTNAKQIIKSVFDGFYAPTQALCTSQTRYCPKKVPTYRGYDAKKAKQLIARYEAQTGKPFPTIPLYSFLPTNSLLTEAVAEQWQSIGVNVKITVVPTIPQYVGDSRANMWSAWVENAVQDSVDPATGTFAMFGVHGLFTGTSDQTLQNMLSRAQTVVKPSVRAGLYQQIFNYLDKMAYAVPIYQSSIITVNSKSVMGYVNGYSSKIVQDTDIWLK